MKNRNNSEDNLRVRYLGLHPGGDLDIFVREKLSEIQIEAPVDSFIHAHLIRLAEKDYKVNILISSGAGHFFASAHGAELRLVLKKVISNVRRQIEKWKDQKYHRGPPRAPMGTLFSRES